MADISTEALNNAFIAARDKAIADGTVNSNGAPKTSSEATQEQLSSDINFFLTMLTTQLKNQDPTQPFDTNQFTQQIAQFSGVQQQVTTNSNLEKLLLASKQSTVSTAVSYLGREIETEGNTGEVIGGQGAFSYVLPAAASDVNITIKDGAGTVVFQGKGNKFAGRNLVIWDAVHYGNGQKQPDGVYTFTIEATDSLNKKMTVSTRAVALVSGVESDSLGNTMLTTPMGAKVNFEDILAVREATRTVLPEEDGEEETANDTTTGGAA